MFDSEGFALFTVLFFSKQRHQPKASIWPPTLLFYPHLLSLPLLSPFSSQLSKGSYAESITVAARRATQWQKYRHAFITSICIKHVWAIVFEFKRRLFFSYVTQHPSEYDHKRHSAAVFRDPGHISDTQSWICLKINGTEQEIFIVNITCLLASTQREEDERTRGRTWKCLFDLKKKTC